jgi:hypothetical protein
MLMKLSDRLQIEAVFKSSGTPTFTLQKRKNYCSFYKNSKLNYELGWTFSSTRHLIMILNAFILFTFIHTSRKWVNIVLYKRNHNFGIMISLKANCFVLHLVARTCRNSSVFDAWTYRFSFQSVTAFLGVPHLPFLTISRTFRTVSERFKTVFIWSHLPGGLCEFM